MKKRVFVWLLVLMMVASVLPLGAVAESWTEIQVPGNGAWLLPSHVKNRKLTHARVPEYVDNIGEGAFKDCKYLEEVDMPSRLDGKVGIGNAAFKNCISLEEIVIPEGTALIDHRAFQGCTELEEVVIPGSVDRIRDQAFEGCLELESVVIRDGVREIEQRAFQNCPELETVVIPASVEKIGWNAFDGCKLTRIYVAEGTEIPSDVGAEVVYGLPDGADSVSGATPVETEPDAVSSATVENTWEGNVLRKDVVAKPGGKVFGGKLARKDIVAVTFLDTLADAPENTFDVSEARDGSVQAWAPKQGSGYHLYIAAEGGVQAPENCSGMFCGYTNAKSIEFGGNFHTENATTMSYMFSHCNSLLELDVSGFDTASVKRMECMFMHCYELETLDLTSFDVAQVVDMGSMFYQCSSLMELDLSSFVGKKNRNTGYMFEKCPGKMKVKWS